MINSEIEWLKQNKLLQLAHNHVDIFKKILVHCLAVKKEKILIIGDVGFEDRKLSALMSAGYFLAAKRLGLDTNLILQSPKSRGERTDIDVIAALESFEQENVVIINATNALGSFKELSRSFRRFAKEKQHKFISTPSLGLNTVFYDKFVSALDIDYIELQKKSQQIKSILDKGNEIHITTEAGTDLYYNIKNKTAVSADGNYILPGFGGNLPAGEVYIPCLGRKVEGKVVVDASFRNRFGTVFIKKPMTLQIEKGIVTAIEGGEEAKLLQESLNWAEKNSKFPWGIRRISEFGIGLNPKAELIGSMIMDEKVLGTSHVALGSNAWFGGSIYAITHFDQVFKNPRIFVDDEELKV